MEGPFKYGGGGKLSMLMKSIPAILPFILISAVCCGQATGPGQSTKGPSVAGDLSQLRQAESDLRQKKAAWREDRLSELTENVRQVEENGDRLQKQEARNLLGVIYLRLGKYEDGLQELNKIEFDVEDPDRAVYRYNLGRAYERTGHLDDALRLYSQSLGEHPNLKPAADGVMRLISEQTSSQARANACLALLDARLTQNSDLCFQQLAEKDANAETNLVLTYLLRRYRDSADLEDDSEEACKAVGSGPKTGCWLDLSTVGKLRPALEPAVNAISHVVTGDCGVSFLNSPECANAILKVSPELMPELAPLFAARGTMFRDLSAKETGESASDYASRAVASFSAAWALDPDQTNAARSAATVLKSFRHLPSREASIRQLGKSVSARVFLVQKLDRTEALESWSWLLEAAGNAVAELTSCPKRELKEVQDDDQYPLYFWRRALEAELRSTKSPAATASAGMPVIVPSTSRPDATSTSSSLALNRHLADCYKRMGEGDLYKQFNEATIPAQRVEAQFDSTRDKRQFHLRTMVYPGAISRTSIQAGLLQALDTPKSWGQGLGGYGQRFASSQSARIIRQGLAWGIDTTFKQEPRFELAPYRETSVRLWYAMSQTFVCRSDRQTRQFAIWRVGSAIGSELISNSWRPPGSGLGDRGIPSAFARAGFVLAGDTAGNVFREFLPKRGKWGKIVREFL